MKATYSEAEETAYENGVLDALALFQEELRKESYYTGPVDLHVVEVCEFRKVEERVCARLLDH